MSQSTDNVQIDLHICSSRLDHKIDSLEDFLRKGEKSSWDDIKKVVTADALCKENDPLDKAFEVSLTSGMCAGMP